MGCVGVKRMKILAGVVATFVVLCLMACPAMGSKQKKTDLVEQVVALNIGMNGYVIGQKLTVDQKKIGEKNREPGAYEGTYKFGDNNVIVVVDKETDRVLALYRQKKDADKLQLKAMVVELMDTFGEPTVLAHDKIIYWAFNKYGAVSEDDFNKARKANQTPNLGIIATVKLNSDFEITPDKQGDDKKDEPSKLSKGTVYYIITSDPLVQQFMKGHKEQ